MKKSSVRLGLSVAWEANVPLTATLVEVPVHFIILPILRHCRQKFHPKPHFRRKKNYRSKCSVGLCPMYLQLCTMNKDLLATKRVCWKQLSLGSIIGTRCTWTVFIFQKKPSAMSNAFMFPCMGTSKLKEYFRRSWS